MKDGPTASFEAKITTMRSHLIVMFLMDIAKDIIEKSKVSAVCNSYLEDAGLESIQCFVHGFIAMSQLSPRSIQPPG